MSKWVTQLIERDRDCQNGPPIRISSGPTGSSPSLYQIPDAVELPASPIVHISTDMPTSRQDPLMPEFFLELSKDGSDMF